jgi:hypothetical protein
MCDQNFTRQLSGFIHELAGEMKTHKTNQFDID